MKTIKTLIKNNIRFVIYALALSTSLYSAAADSYVGNTNGYILAGILGITIFSLEIYVAKLNFHKLYLPLQMQYDRSYSLTEERLMHLVIPIVFYISAFLCVGSYISNSTKIIVIVLVGVIGFILLKNINAYYLRKIDAELRTHYVYDLAKFVTFVCFVFSWQIATNLFETPIIWVIFISIIALLISIIGGFQLQRLEVKFLQLCFILVLVFLSVLAACVYILQLNLPKASLIAIVLFYIYQTLVLHIMAKDLNYQLMLQYITILGATIFTVNTLN